MYIYGSGVFVYVDVYVTVVPWYKSSCKMALDAASLITQIHLLYFAKDVAMYTYQYYVLVDNKNCLLFISITAGSGVSSFGTMLSTCTPRLLLAATRTSCMYPSMHISRAHAVAPSR